MGDRFADNSLTPLETPEQGLDESAPRFVTIEKPSRPWQLWPAASLIVAALGVLVFRLSISDWHIDWPWEKSANPPAAIAGGPTHAQPSPSPFDDSTPPVADDPIASSDSPLELIGPPGPETLASTPAPAHSPVDVDVKPKAEPDPDPAALALSDIEQEADRIRKEREELEKFKEQAGKEIANAPRRPSFDRMPNPALLARRQAEMQQLMMRRMEEHRRIVERMLSAQGRRGAAGRLPGMDDRFDRMFDQMRRDMEAFEREADAMIRDQRNLAFGPRRLAIPPAPDGLDIPKPPAPGNVNSEDEPDEPPADKDANRRNLRRFSFTTPDGVQVQGFEIRSTFRGD